MLPYSAVRRIDRTCPIVVGKVTNGRRSRSLQLESRQRRHFAREIIIRRTLTANSSNGQDEIPHFVLVPQTAAFAQKQNSLRMNSTQHIHYQCSIGRAHTEVDDSDIVCCRRYHVSIFAFYLHAEHLRKHAHILIKIRQQNKFPERIQTLARITRQPVCYYVFFCSFHTQINPAKNVPKPILFPLQRKSCSMNHCKSIRFRRRVDQITLRFRQ